MYIYGISSTCIVGSRVNLVDIVSVRCIKDVVLGMVSRCPQKESNISIRVVPEGRQSVTRCTKPILPTPH